MIKINLATRKQASFVEQGAAGTGTGLSLAGLKNLSLNSEALRDIPLVKIIISLVLVVGSGIFLDKRMEAEVQIQAVELEKFVETEKKLIAEVAKTKGFEAVKQKLDRDEFVLSTKISAIKELIASRSTIPNMFVAISQSIPREVWLQSFALAGGKISIEGMAVDYDNISEFTEKLGANELYNGVSMTRATQGKDDAGDAITQFSISGQSKILALEKTAADPAPPLNLKRGSK